ncbi:MAG: Gldg family protein [Lachnospiraceae bacterium]|nr:Gldg family protein [Lachnospiraceae bacterium]
MIAIAKREFFALFNNIIGWLFVGVVVALFGLYFFLYNLLYGMPSIAQTLAAETIIFMFTVPILTMRILSEERRSRTDQLIMTAPVRTWQIVLGKYLALVGVFALPLCLISVSPLILSMFGDVEYTSCYVALLGFCLYGLMTLALGLFVSSLTESVVISAVVSFVLLFLGYMMASIADTIFSSNEFVSKILKAYDFIGPMDEMANGSLNLSGVVYYVSLTVLFLFLTLESIEKRRWSVSVRRISGSVFSVATIAVLCVIVVVVNVVVSTLPTSMTVFDATEGQYYSITQKTRDFLKDYKQDVKIYVIGTSNAVEDSYAEIPKTLQKYKEANSHIKITYMDPQKNPTFMAEYAGSDLATGSLIVESEKRFKTISASEMYTSEFDYNTYSQVTTGYDGEGQITSALEYVASDDLPKVYILEGHEELTLGGNFSDILAKGNYETKELNLLGSDEVPEDAAALIINGVQSDFSEDDAQKVIRYVQRGGKVLTSIEFLKAPELPNYKSFLEAFGIEVQDGVVAELNKKYYYQNPYYLLPKVESTDATTDLAGELSIFSPFSVGLIFDSSGKGKKITYTDLMSTSEAATSKSGFSSSDEMAEAAVGTTEIKKEPGDPDGPFSVGVQVDTKKGGQMFVLGSSYLLTDASDQMVSFRNSKLFSEILSVLVVQEDDNLSVVVPTKMYDSSRIMASTRAANTYGLLMILVIPLGCLVLGFVIWLRRRKIRRAALL